MDIFKQYATEYRDAKDDRERQQVFFRALRKLEEANEVLEENEKLKRALHEAKLQVISALGAL